MVLKDYLLKLWFLLSGLPSWETLPFLETLMSIWLSFPSLLKLKPPFHSVSLLTPFHFTPIPQQKSIEKSCWPFHRIYYATERKALLTLDEFKPSVFHQWSVCNCLPASMIEGCRVKRFNQKNSKQCFHSQHVLLERENNRKSFVWLTPLLPLTTPQNKRHHIRTAHLFHIVA